MAAIDSLVRQGLDGTLRDETQVVYVSPLKALSNDIRKNLDAPLSGIRAVLREQGLGDVVSAPGCAPAIRPQESASAWVAGHPISWSRRRSHFTSCLGLRRAAACSRPPEP
jgi:hypothetical protein